MASKAKKGTPAPASAKKPAARKRNSKKAGLPTRAEKSAANKAANKAAHALAAQIRADIKEQGRAVANEYIGKLVGRTVEWSDELGDALFALISTGHSMRAIELMDGMPSTYRMLVWLAEDAHPFASVYTRAKQVLVPLYEEEIHRVGVEPARGLVEVEKQHVTKDGDVVDVTERRYGDNVERAKLAVATMQWTLGHLKPRKHGARPDSGDARPNEQLEGLFAALKAGPAQ